MCSTPPAGGCKAAVCVARAARPLAAASDEDGDAGSFGHRRRRVTASRCCCAQRVGQISIYPFIACWHPTSRRASLVRVAIISAARLVTGVATTHARLWRRPRVAGRRCFLLNAGSRRPPPSRRCANRRPRVCCIHRVVWLVCTCNLASDRHEQCVLTPGEQP